eukprot:scaffold2107_cov192-Alexandrium_tamarense.AAC.33
MHWAVDVSYVSQSIAKSVSVGCAIVYSVPSMKHQTPIRLTVHSEGLSQMNVRLSHCARSVPQYINHQPRVLIHHSSHTTPHSSFIHSSRQSNSPEPALAVKATRLIVKNCISFILLLICCEFCGNGNVVSQRRGKRACRVSDVKRQGSSFSIYLVTTTKSTYHVLNLQAHAPVIGEGLASPH